jgi:dynein heavy chain 1, cytosolic
VHYALAPCFEVYASNQDAGDGYRGHSGSDNKGGVPGAKKKMAELEMNLLHLQQNIEIPVLQLPIHELIRAALSDAECQNAKPSLDFIPVAALENSTVLNSLQNHVNGWIKSIQTITKMSRNPESETAAQEINFWLSLESALAAIEEQLRSDGVQLTMDVLRHAKRYQATLSFSADTGLKEAMDLVQKYNVLMHDFPLDDLLAATSLAKVEDALNMIFSHLNKKLRICPYPIRRTLALVEAISGDLDTQVHRLLNGRMIMQSEYRDFVRLTRVANSIWRAWDENLKEFTNVARDVTRRRNEKFIPIKVSPRHIDTQERLKYLSTFRNNHEQLQRTILSVLGPETSSLAPVSSVGKDSAVIIEDIRDVDAVEEVSDAYTAIKDVDVLDTSPEGTQLWVQVEMQYNERTSRVENSIIARLRDRLAKAGKNANEMFRVFSKFNALLVRPKVRGAISEYQTQLLDNVKENIAALHERFKQQYSNSEACLMFRLRDLPPISGSIIWVRQIERQLDSYMKRVEAVLGEDWTLHADGEKLQTESSLFRKKLDTRHLYESWVHEVQNRKLTISGRLFTIIRTRASGNLWELGVNFDPQVIDLFKEVRNLSWLNFQVPHSIITTSKEAQRVYPYAVSLIESARSYVQITHTISSIPDVAPLLHGYHKEAQTLIVRGLPLRWESFVHSYELLMKQSGAHPASFAGRGESRHVQFVRDLALSVAALQTKTSTLVSINVGIRDCVSDLKKCPFDGPSLRALLQSIQNAVDKLNLENYTNLRGWVERLNNEVEQILEERLAIALGSWTSAFNSRRHEDDSQAEATSQDSLGYAKQALAFTPLAHEMTMQNQVIYLDPPLEYIRSSWLEHLDSWLGIVCSLERIKSSRYQMPTLLHGQDHPNSHFTSVPMHCVDKLQKAYNVVDQSVWTISAYLGDWLRYQSLWDLQSDQLVDSLGDDLSRWHQLLLEIRQARSTFDTSGSKKTFGNVTIDYGQVQTKIAAKYDQWQREITSKFGGRVGLRMREVHNDISTSRTELEGQSLGASSTAQAVAFITVVQNCQRKARGWEPEVETFRQGQTTLNRQRYQYPSDWLPIDQINNEWDAFKEILDRKSRIVQEQTEVLRAKIAAEDQMIKSRIAETVIQWNEEKPISGNIEPEHASAVLGSFRSRFEKLETETELVSKAKESLDLPDSRDTTIAAVLEEIHDFMSVWSALSTIWQNINDLRGKPWAGVQTRKLRQSIEGLVKMTKDMPSRMRQYAAFEHVQNVLKQLLKVNTLLSDLKSEAVRERHWVKIFKILKPGKRYSEMSLTVGDVWDLQLISTEAIVKDIIIQARGEMALEEFAKQVRDTWQNYALELVNYRNKCRLIRGWDDLFTRCSENLNSLQAMRHSPYYKEFEEEASSWEDKLNRIHVLFDVWIDVQRQWVYLEGVFTGNTDIKHLLPKESMRFQNINTEFFALMKKVYKSPFILDILTIPGVQKSLERLADLLSKIQKALGEYLERERVSFPRFYFVGDEDLLEIIGNANDTARVAKHFKKMFAGLYGLLVDDSSNIVGITSREGETVTLKKEVSLAKIPKINDWLAALETNVKLTLAELLSEATAKFEPFMTNAPDQLLFDRYLAAHPAQVVVLGTQVTWTKLVQQALESGGGGLADIYESEIRILDLLAATVLKDLDPITRKKCEHLITESVHQRDVVARLMAAQASSPNHYLWLLQMRYVYTSDVSDPLQRLQVYMANAKLTYGYEYLGVPERLVRTPLTDRCFLTLTQALSQRLGGSPYGPAGTGKTESVKALGLQLGRFTLVFCCDDTFDFQAMGRIFLGICQVGAWGCFDEFNRLEERILSAVSQQIQNIQIGLRHGDDEQSFQTELVGRRLRVNSNTGIFITMNPGYAGRSNLPDNLKKLFRSVAMSKPDKELIAEVMLFSQGFGQAKALSKQTVPFFDHCSARLTKQAHYDFGLRALKSVLVSSGGLKRSRIRAPSNEVDLDDAAAEPQIIVQSIRETIAPKLIREDVTALLNIQEEDFPGIDYVPAETGQLDAAIKKIAEDHNFSTTEAWMTKVLQLNQIQKIHHGVMMVGNSGSGKSSIWKVLLQALQAVEGTEGVSHVIDSKVMSKEALYGSLDSTTREWTDGLFTSILRKIVDNLRGEDAKRHWIVFDGDVDPEWVENLNSVLDDNKLLTLPNGERLSIPPNVRIMFEVESLKYATLATVSRCGMVWFSDDTVTSNMVMENYLEGLKTKVFDDLDDDAQSTGTASNTTSEAQIALVDILSKFLLRDNFLLRALESARGYSHIMQFTDIRALNSLFGLLAKVSRTILEYNIQHADFPLDTEQVEAFISKKMLLAVVWGFAGDCPNRERKDFGAYLGALCNIDLPSLAETASLIDFDVSLPQAQWTTWQSQVPVIEVNTHSVTQTDMIIPTVDTVRHESVLYSWLAEHKPLMLCGPPGSGKTMTLFSALRKLPNMEVVGLNFSSATTPELLIKTFDQYCEYRKTLSGVILSPTQIGHWLVVFCDEINLPAPDRYGTQRAISFLRQLVEQNGFWKTSDKTWVTLERIQFVGACNPPTDAGRHALGARFLRHAPLVLVDYPGELSLTQIYGTFNNAILKIIPLLRGYSGALTKAMVQFYSESQAKFTAKIQPHYIYSPRELTRWVRGVYEAIKPLDNLSVEGLVRIWAHEALRLFQDRLVMEGERIWTADLVRRVALEHFPSVDEDVALKRPILFSNWLSKNYVSVDQEQLREFVKARLKTFCEEEVDVPLVLFNDVLEHALRIDRVFRQPQGHLILIGVSGSGKTTLSRFVAWMNGLKIFQIKVHGKYSAEDFDEDLRGVLRACGCRGEKICFIMDESNVLDSGFLEKMNTLLANGEVPGLFEGDEHSSLMTSCKEGAQRQGLLLDSQEELYKWFTQQIVKNLHVVFTMNPPQEGLSSKAATSPALFNRCVLNWMGDWSGQAFYQVGLELTQSVDLDKQNFAAPDSIPLAYRDLSLPATHRDAVINAMVYIHYSIQQLNSRLAKQTGTITYLTPRHYLDFVAHFVRIFNEKRESLEEQQRHLNVGLEKLRDTVDKVRELRASLADKKDQLERKDDEANEKLQRMIADQREAETRKRASLEIQTALEKQDREVAQRREIVENDLAKAEPAVLEAQRSVSNIKRQHLTEVRSMGNPPAGVKLALESVCTLLGHRADSWKTIQGIVRRDDFIASIVNYDNEQQMTPSLRKRMRNDYLSNDDFTYERVNRASKACGPLVQWVQAQVDFSEILDRVGPLREEVALLEEQALQTQAEAKAIENTISKLEESISTYKSEYAALISETQSIKAEMSRVQFKVDRSVSLLDSLSQERLRWETGSKSFETQTTTMIGDVLMAAAFLAYAGFYDQVERNGMVRDWLHQITQSGIACKSNNSITEYLSNADERLKWQRNSLPVDDLCTENAIILQRFNRYPLIIDPSGRTTEFLSREHKDRKLTVTSFLDDTFVKQLESALRFGNPILIQDAEHMDPILNQVLNKEYQKTGGRVLIQLGKQEIDFSPAFKLYMSTRDPSAAFPPDVCSRATFVNFTVTRSSLQTQSLNEVLKSERPDVDMRRTNLMKLQGEFNTNLRRLERKLLQALNESRGNILDDDHVIETLETLKKEATEISRKMVETEGVMTEVENITLEYNAIARACSAVFAILEQLHQLDYSYQFSLQYFIDIFNFVLHDGRRLSSEKDLSRRSAIILQNIFSETYRRTSMSLLQRDRVTLAMLLARASPYQMDRSVLDLVLEHRIVGSDISTTPEQRSSILSSVSHIATVKERLSNITDAEWTKLALEEQAEHVVPVVWKSDATAIDQHLWSLLIVKLFRVDRLVPAAEKFVVSVFGHDFFDSGDDLSTVVKQITASTPIALNSSPGFDASYKVDGLAEGTRAACASIAMGSNEGVAGADKAISNAAANGSWVLVKNVHLAPQWLQSLEKRLGSLKPHQDFRLFLSMESSPKIPANLIRASRMLRYEQPAGIRANMKDSISSLSVRGSRPPVEKARLYFLLSFFHAVVQERLRYAPALGWKGFWEFNDSDVSLH